MEQAAATAGNATTHERLVMKTEWATRKCGFTLVDFMVVMAVLAAAVVLLLPTIRPPRHNRSPRITCMNNLKLTSLAYRLWATDNGNRFPVDVSVTNGGAMEAVASGNFALVFQVMSNELGTPKILFCPTDKPRIQATAFANATAKGIVPFLGNSNLSYFVGLDATPASPQMFLSGDDNLLVAGAAVKPGILSLWTNTHAAWSDKRHEKQGNVGLADGSVQGFSSSKLAEALRSTGVVTNRLAVP